MRSLPSSGFLFASVLVACWGTSGCSGDDATVAPASAPAGKMDTGKMGEAMDKMDTGKMGGAMDKMDTGKMGGARDKMEKKEVGKME
jgi:hypothetical protein